MERIVGGHMDGLTGAKRPRRRVRHRPGDGTRVFHAPDVKTERTIRFALWNNEKPDRRPRLRAQRQELQGKENPAGSGSTPSRSGSA
jgi:hypothetical protein